MRWLIRYEPVRTPKFGETRRDVSMWVVRAYEGTLATRPEDRNLSRPLAKFTTLRQAHRWCFPAAIVHSHEISRRRRPINLTTIPR
ncbi:hypothetical protein AB0P19_02185 [Microbacterium oleivorans]|uniref:hypothetical protein n=1 Tax=Microbacterium oleivorans TaxID=273677 RepID=UPI0034148073